MKKTLSILLSLIMVMTTLCALPFSAFAKEEISEIEAISNISSIIGYGNEIVNPDITITKGAPARYNTGGAINWEKKVDGSFVDCSFHDTFDAGTYRLWIMLGVYSSDYSTHTLSDSVTVKIDGQDWTIAVAPFDAGSYSSLGAISPEFEIHNYGVDWKNDETGHWHQCTACDDKKDFAAHTPDHEGSATTEYAIKCSVCGFEIEPQVAHVHTFDREVVADEYIAAAATCQSKALYYKSCECGQKGTETFESGDALPHNEGTEWKTDDSNHWHICVNPGCGEVVTSSVSAHIYDDENDAYCNVCGYKRSFVKTEISEIEGTSDIADIAVFGETVKNPAFDITKGSPAKYNSGGELNWYKKEGDSFIKCSNGDVFEHGVYRIQGMFNISAEDYDRNTFAENVSVTIDGTQWTVSTKPFEYSTYVSFGVYSPEFTVHNYTDSVTPPTCVEKGYTTHTCECGDSYTDTYVDAFGHTSDEGTVTKKATYTEAGELTYKCTVCGETLKTVEIAKLAKKANTLSAKGKTVTLKVKSLKKKNQTVKLAKAITVKNAKGAVTFKKSSGNKKISVAKNGKITVKKGLKKGTYKVKVKVTAAGNKEYKTAVKTVTVTIIVK